MYLDYIIKNYKKTLKNNGFKISTIEKVYNNIYSVKVIDENTGFFTYGKGFSLNEALVSGLGEFLERVSFGVLSSYSYFYYSYNHMHDDLIMYHGMLSDKEYKIRRFDNFVKYRSTGMASGNSFKDAFVRASLEIFERVVEYKIFSQKISVKSYEIHSFLEGKNILEKFSGVCESVFDNENKIYIIDCFSETNLPVVGLLVLDLDLKKYVCRFAAHPVFEIALKKAVMEMFQFQDYDGVFKYLGVPFDEQEDTLDNLISLITNGRGKFPIKRLLNVSEGKHVSVDNCFLSISDNYKDEFEEDIPYEYCLSLFRKKEWSPYYRKVDYKDFCCIHIVVPNVSNIYEKMMNGEKNKREISDLCVSYLEKSISEKDFTLNITKLLVQQYCYSDYDTYRRIGIHSTRDILRLYYGEVKFFAKNHQMTSGEQFFEDFSKYIGNKLLLDNIVPICNNMEFKNGFDTEKILFSKCNCLNLE